MRIALSVKDLAYETAPIDLRPEVNAQRSPEYLALNPEGLVPLLIDGTRAFSQSLAIIEYLEETHPQPALLPRAAADRARVRALSLLIACEMAPLNNSGVLSYLRGPPLSADESEVNGWYARWIARGFEALEQEVQALSGDGAHMFGTAVTLADVCLVPQMYNARRYRCDLEPYPRLRAIGAHLEALPAFARAAPERFAPA